jgi:hypothetical protein
MVVGVPVVSGVWMAIPTAIGKPPVTSRGMLIDTVAPSNRYKQVDAPKISRSVHALIMTSEL